MSVDEMTRQLLTGEDIAQAEAGLDPDVDRLLNELEELYADEQVTGPDITPRLAQLVEKMIKTKLPEDTIKNKLKACPTPGNVPLLNVTRVNSVVWEALRDVDRAWDVGFQHILHPVMVSVRHMCYALNTAMARADKDENTIKQILAAITILTILINCVNDRRRGDIKDAIDPKFGRLCTSKEPPQSGELFGADVSGQMKELTEARELARKLRRPG